MVTFSAHKLADVKCILAVVYFLLPKYESIKLYISFTVAFILINNIAENIFLPRCLVRELVILYYLLITLQFRNIIEQLRTPIRIIISN